MVHVTAEYFIRAIEFLCEAVALAVPGNMLLNFRAYYSIHDSSRRLY